MRSADLQADTGHGKRLFPGRGLLAGAVGLALAAVASGQVGGTFETLIVKGQEYRQVRVIAVSPVSMTIRHAGGLAQVGLRDLPEPLSAAMGYDQEKAAAFERQLAEEMRRQIRKMQSRAALVVRRTGDTAVDRAMALFGTAPRMNPTDLRPRFSEFDLAAQQQGLRPSCAVFAVVSALEYQNARAVGRTEKLSEEYVIWATRRSMGLRPVVRGATGNEDAHSWLEADAGFSLGNVLAAIRAYGVPSAAEMPNSRVGRMGEIPDPPAALIELARRHRQIAMQTVPGITTDVRVRNILHLLNEGVPVAIGLMLPGPRPGPSLTREMTPQPFLRHAVTLVGYSSATGQPEDIRFVFRNSWGTNWGEGGYGYMDAGYLRASLLSAVVVEARNRVP